MKERKILKAVNSIPRGDWIRTSGPCFPKAVLYQAELHPVLITSFYYKSCESMQCLFVRRFGYVCECVTRLICMLFCSVCSVLDGAGGFNNFDDRGDFCG